MNWENGFSDLSEERAQWKVEYEAQPVTFKESYTRKKQQWGPFRMLSFLYLIFRVKVESKVFL